MGRPFQKEIDYLNSTYEYAMASNVSLIESFIYSLSTSSLVLVGSGGSFSVAKAFETLYQRSGIGLISKSITPFELVDYKASIRNVNVALFTAGGNNADTVNSCKFITSLSPVSFLVLCTNEKSKVESFCEEYNLPIYFGKSIPSGKDGFLAVNSLIASILFATKAFFNIFPNNKFFSLDSEFDFTYNQCSDENAMMSVLGKKDIIVLHGGMTTPIATDIESKFSEAALGSVHLVDYRNFAHGRHYWLKNNINSTSIIALISPEELNIAQKTLALIPSEIPIYSMSTTKNNIMGMLELFRLSFHLTLYAGKYNAMDPGKPHVPDFGRKLYHISYNYISQSKYLEKLDNRAAYKKCNISNSFFEKYKSNFTKFYKKLTLTEFDGIVFDYDGTIKERLADEKAEKRIYEYLNMLISNGIYISFASGRGKSIRTELQAKIEKEYWGNIFIAYYNGGEVATLDDDFSPRTDGVIHRSLQHISDTLVEQFGNDSIEIDLRPKQLTIIIKDLTNNAIIYLIKESIAKISDVKILQSGHSIDIIPIGSSKTNILKIAQHEGNYIYIGDSGQENGNDYEMLSTEFGISVNRVSKSFDTCWNFAPNGLNGAKATLYYLEKIIPISGRKFKFANKNK